MMSAIIPRGVIPAMLTAFNSDDSLDIGGTRAFAEWLIERGVHGLAPCGSTGEGAAMTDAERALVIKAVVEQAGGRVPIFAGIIHYATRQAIDLSKAAIDAGADGLMVLLPFYYQPTINDAIDYLRDVSAAIGQPIMVYNNPWFAGYELSPAQIKSLVEEGVVHSVKSAHGDPMRVNYLKYLCGESLSALYGHDYAPLEAFVAGADGWLSGIPNIVPELSVELFEAVSEAKDLRRAQEIWRKMAPLAYYFMYEREGENPAPHWLQVFKEALRMMDMDIGLPRRPTYSMSKSERAKLRSYLMQVYPDISAAPV